MQKSKRTCHPVSLHFQVFKRLVLKTNFRSRRWRVSSCTWHAPNYFQGGHHFYRSDVLLLKNGFTVHGLFLYPLRYPDYYIRRRIRTFDTQGVENNIELGSMLYLICNTTLWRHTETLIRSYTFCFCRALSRHSHGERLLSASWRKYFYQRICGPTQITHTRVHAAPPFVNLASLDFELKQPWPHRDSNPDSFAGSMALNALPY